MNPEQYQALIDRLEAIESITRPSARDQARMSRMLEMLATPTVTVQQPADPNSGLGARVRRPFGIDATVTYPGIDEDAIAKRAAEIHEAERLAKVMKSSISNLSPAELQMRYEAEENAAMIAMARAQRTLAEIARRKEQP